MDINFLVEKFPSTTQTFIQNQVVGLLNQDQNVSVFAESKSDSDTMHDVVEEYDLDRRVTYSNAPQSYREGLQLLSDSLPPLLRNSQIPKRVILREFAAGTSAPRRISNLRTLSESEITDVYHAHFGTVGNRYLSFMKCHDVPYIVSFYGRDASQSLQVDPHVYDELFKRADAVTVLSEDMRSAIIEAGCPKENTEILPLSIDTDRFPYHRRSLDGGPIRLLTVARFVEKKGIMYALEAVAAIAENHDLRYTIIGDGERRDLIETKIEEHSLEDVVDLRGWQPQSVVADEMAEAHLFLLPSVTAENGDKEGTPTVLLEAQSMGLPVVATHHAGIPEIVDDGETGLLVPERDSEALTRALETLLAEPDRWSEMGRHGREHIEQSHSIEAVTDNLMELYNSVL
ncbi:glycosyltransferase [Halorubrum sp. HHNYT27]|uniref:glycosyltransferase n=1 Tax=Halorubrum sp. HHNYT27 TaxID=3402275 RepID=UPI003EB9E3A6